MTSIKRRQRHAANQRRAPGLRRRMLAWFEANPHDDLTIELLALRFDATLSSVKSEVSRLISEGAIEALRVFRLKPVDAPDEAVSPRRERPAETEPDNQPDLFEA